VREAVSKELINELPCQKKKSLCGKQFNERRDEK
jgi:hypothetical protein